MSMREFVETEVLDYFKMIEFLRKMKVMVLILILVVYSSLVSGQGLYFRHRGKILLNGDQLAFNEIGNEVHNALICITREVNSQCCRSSDGGAVGDWFFPSGRKVSRGREVTSGDILVRRAFTEEVRLMRRLPGRLNTEFGNFTCRVPGVNGSSHEAIILLYPTPCSPSQCNLNANCKSSPEFLSRDFECTCIPPYEGNGVVCTVPDPCLSYPCPDGATCNRNGNDSVEFFCTCPASFEWDGDNCTYIPTTEPVTTTELVTTTEPLTTPTDVPTMTIPAGTIVEPTTDSDGEDMDEDEDSDPGEPPFSPRPQPVTPRVLGLISEEEHPEIVPRVPEDMPPGPRSIFVVFKIIPEQGDVEKVQILVQRQPSFSKDITTYFDQRQFSTNFPQYVAMEINMKDDNMIKKRDINSNEDDDDGTVIDIVIGVIMSCGRFDDPCNGPLEPDTEYAIRYRVLSGNDVVDYDFGVVERTAPRPRDTSSIVAGVVLVVVLFFLIVIVIVIIFLSILHRDRILAKVAKKTRSVSTCPPPETPPPENEEKDVELDDEDYDEKIPDLENTSV